MRLRHWSSIRALLMFSFPRPCRFRVGRQKPTTGPKCVRSSSWSWDVVSLTLQEKLSVSCHVTDVLISAHWLVQRSIRMAAAEYTARCCELHLSRVCSKNCNAYDSDLTRMYHPVNNRNLNFVKLRATNVVYCTFHFWHFMFHSVFFSFCAKFASCRD